MCAPVLNHFIAVFQTSTWHEIKDANFQDFSTHFQELITYIIFFFNLKARLYIYFFIEYSTSASDIVVILVCNTIRTRSRIVTLLG